MWNRRLALVWGLRIWLAWIFIGYGWDKMADPAQFAESIDQYELAPSGLVNLLALFLPWLEVWCGFALLFLPPLRRSAWFLVGWMLIVFTVAKVSALVRGLDISCGCHGAGGTESIQLMDVAFNLWLLAGWGAAWALERRGMAWLESVRNQQ